MEMTRENLIAVCREINESIKNRIPKNGKSILTKSECLKILFLDSLDDKEAFKKHGKQGSKFIHPDTNKDLEDAKELTSLLNAAKDAIEKKNFYPSADDTATGSSSGGTINPNINYYDILGVDHTATISDIKARMELIREAFAILSDPEQRRIYDSLRNPFGIKVEQPCPKCMGLGKYKEKIVKNGVSYSRELTCPLCNGKGKVVQ